MMDWTDRHCRYFLRLISRHTLLYTEMVTTGALLHGDRERLLGYHPDEHPLVLQLGGSVPHELALCARMGEDAGYDAINLNVGCPSPRVQTGRFGACLMAEPELVAESVAAMQDAVGIPVTVKHRIGIDELDSYEALCHFISTVAGAGCRTFIIHARKAWLQGLSPRENREKPPLRYDIVQKVKQDFPDLHIVLNGGIMNLEAAEDALAYCDGVMIGRAVYHDPYLLAEADQRFYGATEPVRSRHEVLEDLLPYIDDHMSRGGRLHAISRHILGLFHGVPGGRRWRRSISEQAGYTGSALDLLRQAAPSDRT